MKAYSIVFVRATLLMASQLLAGCGNAPVTDGRVERRAADPQITKQPVPMPSPNECRVVQTSFPTVGLGKAIALCSECDGNTCAEMGDVCDAYGELCTFNGFDGVCTMCCAGEIGELRCQVFAE